MCTSSHSCLQLQLQTGYTMGQRREVNPLALPSLVQCTQSRVIQSTEWQSVEWAVCKLLMNISFNVCTAYWVMLSRAMLSSTPSPLQVSLEVRCAFMECMCNSCLPTSNIYVMEVVLNTKTVLVCCVWM